MKSALACCCLLLVALILAGAAEAGTVPFTDSGQLLLGSNAAAVNFYYNPSAGDPNGGVLVTAPIQGVTFQNLNVVTGNASAFALTNGGSLTINLPNTDSGSARATTASIGGADAAAATQLATSISYFAYADTGTLDFAFGSGAANRNVTVQLVGGTESWGGALTASVGGNPVGTMSAGVTSSDIELLTFNAKTDALGNLDVSLAGTQGPTYPSSPYYGIAGVVVSAVTPEPSSLILCGLGAIGLLAAARGRRKA